MLNRLDVADNTNQIRRTSPAAATDRLGRYGIIDEVTQVVTSSTSLDDSMTGTLNNLNGCWKVSAKIQQLLNTLKGPKGRPLTEFYEDDDIELELAAYPKEPNAPKPECGPITPVLGNQLLTPSGLPRSLGAAIQRYGSASYKAATGLD